MATAAPDAGSKSVRNAHKNLDYGLRTSVVVAGTLTRGAVRRQEGALEPSIAVRIGFACYICVKSICSKGSMVLLEAIPGQ